MLWEARAAGRAVERTQANECAWEGVMRPDLPLLLPKVFLSSGLIEHPHSAKIQIPPKSCRRESAEPDCAWKHPKTSGKVAALFQRAWAGCVLMHMWSTCSDSWGKSSGWGKFARLPLGRNEGAQVLSNRDENRSSDVRERTEYLLDHFDPITRPTCCRRP